MDDFDPAYCEVAVPADAWRLLTAGTVNLTDLFLLVLVDGLPKEYDAKGVGRSGVRNRDLAASLKVSRLHTSSVVKKLRRLGLLKASTSDGVRWLRVCWTRCSELLETADYRPWDQPPPLPFQFRPGHTTQGSALLRPPKGGSQGAEALEAGRSIPGFGKTAGSERGESQAPTHKGFFPQPASKKGGKLTPFHFWCADRLRAVVTKVFKVRKAWTRTKWAQEVKTLQREVEDDTDRIEAVLDYLESDRMKGPARDKLPRVSGARHFRKTFSWIEDRMNKDHAYRGKTITRTQVGEEVVRRLSRHRWPMGSGVQLPEAVEASLAFVLSFVEGLKKARARDGGSVRADLAAHLLRKLGRPGHFVERWFEDVYEAVRDWPTWSGNLLAMSPSRGSKRFLDLCRGWTQDYLGKPDRFDDLLEALP